MPPIVTVRAYHFDENGLLSSAEYIHAPDTETARAYAEIVGGLNKTEVLNLGEDHQFAPITDTTELPSNLWLG